MHICMYVPFDVTELFLFSLFVFSGSSNIILLTPLYFRYTGSITASVRISNVLITKTQLLQGVYLNQKRN